MSALRALPRIADEDPPPYDAGPQAEPRCAGFGIVDPEVRALRNGYATAVYEVLAAHVNPDGACWPSLATICEHVGWSKPTVIKAIKALTDAGLVTVEVQRHHGYVIGNRYTLPLRCRTKSTTFTQSSPIMAEAVNDVDSGGKGDLLRQSTTLTQAVNDVDSGGKRRLHKQDSVKQDSSKQDDSARGRRFTEKDELTDAYYLAAIAVDFPLHLVPAEFAEFKDYWISATGQNAVKRDWPATFRNHLRRQFTRQRITPVKHQTLDQLKATGTESRTPAHWHTPDF